MTAETKPRTKGAPKNRAAAARRRLRFAEFYAGDPTSGTFRDAAASLRAVFAEEGRMLKPASARRMAIRYLAKDEVIAEIDKIQTTARVVTGMAGPEFVERCLEREAALVSRGGRGDSAAAAKYMELAGKALGVLITKVEDVTPPERRLAATPEGFQKLIDAGERLRRLQSPNPLPEVTAKVSDGPVVADLTPDVEFEDITDTAPAPPTSNAR